MTDDRLGRKLGAMETQRTFSVRVMWHERVGFYWDSPLRWPLTLAFLGVSDLYSHARDAWWTMNGVRL